MFQQFPFKTPSIRFGHGAISMLGMEARKLEDIHARLRAPLTGSEKRP